MRELNDNVNKSQLAPEDGVLDLIHNIMHQYRSQQYQVLRDGPHDITHMESKVLSYFEHRPGATQSDLARHTGRDKAQLARLIKGLRDRGLLDGEADEADRRNTKLSLTAIGKSIQHTLFQQAKLLNSKAVKGLNNEEQQQILALLQRMKSNLDAPT
ncbi:MarR family winged helix-turn-helix transcriptional regulator [Solimicrobium silvestre]|uniref:Transcriptional regulator n=1 Tax=Solimicrobium silvestre TaxID=2099400 RepID=A0A2S9H299_9BURK|nr:MarR family winged helix-turn-helix transcriptional regulator [Solimicrobium silvestre]PRC94104.1 Transcriptional regulator [Solimicrobium silvestre]